MIFPYAGGQIDLDPRDGGMFTLQSTGRWEWRKTDYMRQHLKKGHWFIDAGAYNGYFTLLAASLVGGFGKVWAFEPDRQNWQRLCDNVIRNDLTQVNFPQLALGDSVGLRTLYMKKQRGWSTLLPGDGEGYPVPVRRLDEVVYQLPFMMKIDVEGLEAAVLAGATGVLEREGTCHILMDLHPELGVTPKAVEKILHDYGFRLYSIRDDNEPIESIPDDLVELLAVRHG